MVFSKNGYERSARQAVWLESVDSNKAWTPTKLGLEQSVDSNKAWTRTKRGLEQSVDSNKEWTRTKRGLWGAEPPEETYVERSVGAKPPQETWRVWEGEAPPPSGKLI